jgi:ERCC4-type nuclease
MFTVLRDTREKKPHIWEPSDTCAGTIVKKLYPGDYTLEGFENVLAIERKASTGEFAVNISEKRFQKEIDALSVLPHPYLLLEFSMSDILSFPENSGIPTKLWPKLKCNSNYILSKIFTYQMKYNIRVLLCDNRENCWYIMNRIFNRFYENKEKYLL